jgi:predicted deacylase
MMKGTPRTVGQEDEPLLIVSLTPEVLAGLPDASITEFLVPFGRMASGARTGFPLTVAKGVKPGPCLWINGQVHGDELNGVIAALDFVRGLDLSVLSGIVVVAATANPFAMDARRKRNPWDDLDLDHCFPGHAHGVMTERMAATFFPSVAACANVVISMHATNTTLDSEPFGVFKPAPSGGPVRQAEQLRLMAQFGLTELCFMAINDREGELPGHIAGGLDYQALLRGMPSVMVELGSGGRADARHIAQGIAGMTNVARLYRMLPGEHRPVGNAILVEHYDHVTCSGGGLFRRLLEPGANVAPGQIYGEIRDLHGRVVERLALPHAAILIGVRRDPVVHTGDRVAFVARKWSAIDA